jgi:hypothetical protein
VRKKREEAFSRIRKRKKSYLKNSSKDSKHTWVKGNGPLKSSHLKRQQAHTESSQKGRYSTYKTNCFPLKSSLLY